MTFLAPWNMAIAASVAIPALLALYMLRLRRQRVRVSSTLLWFGSVRDLEGNVPFQRVRPSWMLLLQLLALLMLLAAVGDPVIPAADGPSTRTVIVVDVSASMSVRAEREGDAPGVIPTRFDRAIDEAEALARRALTPGSGREAMLVVVGSRARLVSGFDPRFAVIRSHLRTLEPTDEALDATGAIQFLRSLLRGIEPGTPIEVVVLSDGRMEALRNEAGAIPARVRFVNLAAHDIEPAGNIGVVALGVRRDPRDAELVRVIATFAADLPEVAETLVEVLVDGRVMATRALRIGGSSPEAVHRFELRIPGAAVIKVRHRLPDALAADDSAAVVLDRPRRPSIAIMHGDGGPDGWVRRVVQEMDPERLRIIRAADPNEAALPEEGDERFDLVIFDRVRAAEWPMVPSLIIDASGPDLERVPDERPGARRIRVWDREHPLLRHAVLDELAFMVEVRTLPPGDARVLASDVQGAIMFSVMRNGAEHVVLNLQPGRSTWPSDVSFAIFMQNLVDHAVADVLGTIGRSSRTGDSIELLAGAPEVVLRGPEERRAHAIIGERVRMPAPSRVGVYEVVGAVERELLVVNLLSRQETSVVSAFPPETIVEPAPGFGGEGQGGEQRGRSLWRWLLAAVLLALAAEWLLYLRSQRS